MGVLCVDLVSQRPAGSRTCHLLTWTKVTPNRGRGHAHIAGHSKCYLSSAKGVSVPWSAGDSSVWDGFSGVPQRELQ